MNKFPANFTGATCCKSDVSACDAARGRDKPTDAGPHRVGVVSAFTPNESRPIEPIRSISRQVAELAARATEPMSLSFNKTVLYNVNTPVADIAKFQRTMEDNMKKIAKYLEQHQLTLSISHTKTGYRVTLKAEGAKHIGADPSLDAAWKKALAAHDREQHE